MLEQLKARLEQVENHYWFVKMADHYTLNTYRILREKEQEIQELKKRIAELEA